MGFRYRYYRCSFLLLLCAVGCAQSRTIPGGEDPTGSDTDAITGIELPREMNILALSLDSQLRDGDVPTDYTRDVGQVWINTQSTRPLDTVNMILCMIGQTAADQLVNEGPYVALVNATECDPEAVQLDNGETTYEEWLVDATRASNSEPMIVRLWLDSPDGEESDEEILVELRVFRAPDVEYPNGEFEMDFIGQNAAGERTMRGTLVTNGALGFTFQNHMNRESEAGTEAAVVLFDDASQSSGVARTYEQWQSDYEYEERDYRLAFDPEFVRQDNSDAADTSCSDRNTFRTNTWNYWLYTEDGTRVAHRGGFPFRRGESRGYFSYWGIWLDNDEVLEDGDVIMRDDDGEAAELTVRISNGLLTREVVSEVPLADAIGEQFTYHQPLSTILDVSGISAEVANADAFGIVVTSDSEFQITHALVYGTDGAADETLAFSMNIDLEPNQNLWLYSESLGGSVSYTHDPSAVSPSLLVFAQERVNPDQTEETQVLYCRYDCLRGGVTGDALQTYDGDDTLHAYSVETDGNGAYRLIDEGNGEEVNLVELGGGGMTLFMTTETDFSDDVHYRWDTGPDQWQRLATAIDATGSAVHFDRPLNFIYEHELENDANDDSDYVGRRYSLHYDGHLGGIPNFQNEDGDWEVQISLRAGTTLTRGGINYLLKPKESEQTLSDTEASACAHLDIDRADALVTETWPPFLVNDVFDPEARPDVRDLSPRVVDGELVD